MSYISCSFASSDCSSWCMVYKIDKITNLLQHLSSSENIQPVLPQKCGSYSLGIFWCLVSIACCLLYIVFVIDTFHTEQLLFARCSLLSYSTHKESTESDKRGKVRIASPTVQSMSVIPHHRRCGSFYVNTSPDSHVTHIQTSNLINQLQVTSKKPLLVLSFSLASLCYLNLSSEKNCKVLTDFKTVNILNKRKIKDKECAYERAQCVIYFKVTSNDKEATVDVTAKGGGETVTILSARRVCFWTFQY